MSEDTKIQWCDHTFNPWEGCTKISAGCAHCYAETRNHRFGADNWGKGKPRRRTSAANWGKPLKWNREACVTCADCECGIHTTPSWHRPRVFCASLADWLDDEVPIDWFADILGLICECRNLDFLLLTKRPENFRPRVTAVIEHYGKAPSVNDSFCAWLENWLSGDPPGNVWFGVSCEDQQRADERMNIAETIPANIRFVSYEPALEGVDFHLALRKIANNGVQPWNWIIAGGESGHGARLCDVDWIKNSVEQCRKAGVSPFVKQLGANVMGREMDKWVCRMRDKKGGDMDEWPRELRIREWPKSEVST